MTDYTPDLQKLFLEMLMDDAQSFVRVANIYNPDNFDQGLKPTAEFLKDHSEKYKVLPTHDQVKAQTCLLYTSPSPRDVEESRMPSSA